LLAADAQVSARCANLPSGATCSYANGVVTIAASSATPVGTYHALLIFTAQQRLATVAQHRAVFGGSALALLPFGFVLMAGRRRKRAWLLLAPLALVMLVWAGCGAEKSTSSTVPAMVTSQKSVPFTLSIQ